MPEIRRTPISGKKGTAPCISGKTGLQKQQFLFLSKGLVDKTQAVFKRCKCILPALLRCCPACFCQKPHRFKCLCV